MLFRSEDEKMQRIADLRQKAIMDEKAIYEKGIEKGIQRGIGKDICTEIAYDIEKCVKNELDGN